MATGVGKVLQVRKQSATAQSPRKLPYLKHVNPNPQTLKPCTVTVKETHSDSLRCVDGLRAYTFRISEVTARACYIGGLIQP